MFCVIYSFQVKEDKEAPFIEAWEELTKLIYQYEGSLGSRIHKASDDLYLAYAQWPSKKQWQNSGDLLPSEASKWRDQMRSCCQEIKTIHELELISDLLKTNLF